ncbi:hypothetical protein [Burkholderia cenocepacia]|uniref:hypothetical protein n=1 Tax=Burkholderia cenocepacia TaxID=95486 RepID=UPI002854D6A2|nr:hypothetical protein [Burkholderia cenocepacia]MDR8047985.1 hypothetical protein [Burkholderia cenocepacia]
MTDANERIGRFSISLINAQADQSPVLYIVSPDDGETWLRDVPPNRGTLRKNQWLSFSASDATTPISFENISGEIDIYASIYTSKMQIKDGVQLDGSIVIELKYL